MQRVATDDYINSGLRRQTVRMTSGTVEAFAGHVPLELLSRFHATGCTRERPLRQAAPSQLKCVSVWHLWSYLPEAAFFLHVLLDGLPNATLIEKGAPGGLLKLLVAAVSLQGELHDAHRLQGRWNSWWRTWLMICFWRHLLLRPSDLWSETIQSTCSYPSIILMQ